VTTLRILALRFGDERHGVNRYGHDLALALGSLDGTEVSVASSLDPAAVGPDTAAVVRAHRPHVVHLHVTEQLFGADPEQAAERLAQLAASTTAPIVSTLHDVPTAGTALDRRRRRAYDAALALSERVIVSSCHERARLGPTAAAVAVIPLLVPPRPAPAAGVGAPACVAGGEVAVLGYLYPGKGHEHVLAACAAAALDGSPAPPLVALGTAAPRHPELPAELEAAGRRAGVEVTVTGWIPDAELWSRLDRAACPVVPNHGVSASASLATWVGAGRRPLVAAGPYAEEFAVLAPGSVVLYPPQAGPVELGAAIRRALADPATTRADRPPVALAPGRIAAQHRALFAEVAR
jgi:hypothetical protein